MSTHRPRIKRPGCTRCPSRIARPRPRHDHRAQRAPPRPAPATPARRVHAVCPRPPGSLTPLTEPVARAPHAVPAAVAPCPSCDPDAPARAQSLRAPRGSPRSAGASRSARTRRARSRQQLMAARRAEIWQRAQERSVTPPVTQRPGEGYRHGMSCSHRSVDARTDCAPERVDNPVLRDVRFRRSTQAAASRAPH